MQSGTFDLQLYKLSFQKLTDRWPYDYQVRLAGKLARGRNVVLRAPTGTGKTLAVLVPFLIGQWQWPPFRLIYALPLRTLAQSVYNEALQLIERQGSPGGVELDDSGRQIDLPFVTLQTGEQPDDPFFDRGRIIVTTYDQLLSGLLDGPYGLSSRLHNVNAAAVVGSLVVFDEFHLMDSQKAFLTATALLHLFRDLCQSVWMTATATQPLEALLRDALDAEVIPESEGERDELFGSLPSVTTVTRDVIVETEPLSAEVVLRRHTGRSIVLANTVARAQALFEALEKIQVESRQCFELLLLHSRFFKEDRRAIEGKLRYLFGIDAKDSAILVATQVIEAGIDISCDQLHTELCPMNALVQRAGRCARFKWESGVVHVYPLPQEDRAWLPYGDLSREHETLTRTRQLLDGIGHGTLHPGRTADWVQQVHGPEDERALREGWQMRVRTCVGRIEQSAILRDPKRVADLIRGDDTDSVRVVISEEGSPGTPGTREALTLSRWSLAKVLHGDGPHAGWFWSWEEPACGKPLKTEADLRSAYIFCLRPVVAAYDPQVGLRLGIAGFRQSPHREEPCRPGYAPLRRESWTDHARGVLRAARSRLEREQWRSGLASFGFCLRFGLAPECLLQAVEACALLHDLGKLQEGWQRWAEHVQRRCDPKYRHDVPLAHTDSDGPLSRSIPEEACGQPSRPPHACASAYYGAAFLAWLLASVPDEKRSFLASACAAAVLAHHGGWLPHEMDLGIQPLYSGWERCMSEVAGWAPSGETIRSLQDTRDKHSATEQLLKLTTGPDQVQEWWPVVAYLTRTLRLSDQRATAEETVHE